MNRRRFIQSLVAVFSLPAAPTLSLRSATAAVPTAAAVPTQARFWVIYMSALHGECTPKTLQNLLNIPAADAKNYVAQLIADGTITPHPLLQRSVSKILKTDEDSLLDSVKKRLDMKAQTEPEEADSCETFYTAENLDEEAELLEDDEEIGLDVIAEDETIEAETTTSDGSEIKS